MTNPLFFFSDDDENELADTGLTVDKVLAVRTRAPEPKLPVVRGKLKKGSESFPTTVRISEPVQAMIFHCLSEDTRFNHRWADFIRDAIMDRIDKHNDIFADSAYKQQWRDIEGWHKMEEQERVARDRFEYLDRLEMTVKNMRRVGDDYQYREMLNTAQGLYQTAAPKIRETLKTIFPEIE